MKRGLLFKCLLLAAALLLTGSCSSKYYAAGKVDEIYVFADSLDWVDYKEPLRSIFSREYLMPIPEPEFVIHWRPYRELERYKTFKNVFFLGRLDSKEPVSQEVSDLVVSNPQIVQGIRNGDYFHIPQHDVWSLGQYVLFLVAPDRDTMIQRILDLGKLAYQDFRKDYYRRVKDEVFTNNRNEDMAEYLQNHYPFSITMQKDYKLVDESKEDKYVWLRRVNTDRDRSLVVHWMPYSDSLEISREWIVQQRNRLGQSLFSGDVVVEDETSLERVRFLSSDAWRLVGTWMNPKLFVGGPFRTIVLKDEQSKLIYMIDIYVQAIDQRKRYYLDQLDIMANTFVAKNHLEQ